MNKDEDNNNWEVREERITAIESVLFLGATIIGLTTMTMTIPAVLIGLAALIETRRDK